MGLRTPQDLAANQSPTRALPQARVQSITPTEISTKGLDKVDAAIEAEEKYRVQKETSELNFFKSQANIDMDGIRYKAEGKVGASTGFKAEDERIKQGQYLRDAIFQKIEKYPPKYRKYAEQIAASQLNKYDKATIKYSLKQAQDAEVKGLDTQISNGLTDLVTFSGDQRDFSEQLESVRGFTTERARNLYGYDDSRVLENGLTVGETIANESKVAVSTGLTRSIQFQASVEATDRAKELLLYYQDQMTDQDKIKAQKAIEAAEASSANRNAIDRAETILEQTQGDLVKAEKMAADTASSVKEYNQVTSVIKNKNFVSKEQKRLLEENATAAIYERARNGQSYEDVIKQLPADMQVKLRQEIADVLNRNNGSLDAVVTDWNKYNDAFKELYSMEGGQEAVKSPSWLISKRPYIAPQQMVALEAEWNRLYRSESNAQARINRSTSETAVSMFNRFADENNIIDAETLGQQRANFMMFYNNLIDRNPKISARELELQLNAHLTKSFQPKKGWKLMSPSTWFNTQERKFDIATEAPKVDVHPSWVESIKAQIKAKKGADPTDAEVDKVIKANSKKFDFSKPYQGSR